MTSVAERRHDGLNWHAFAHVDRYSPDQCAYADTKVADQLAWYRPGSRRLAREQAQGFGAHYDGLLAKILQRMEPEDGRAEADGNILVTTGLTSITALLVGTGGSGKLFNIANASAVCGVGTSATSATVGDTVLGGNGTSTTAYYQQADSTFPTVSAGVITMQATFASANANFAWNEWCWASGTGTITPGFSLGTVYATNASFSMWNHKIASLGTKASGAAWVFTTTITLS